MTRENSVAAAHRTRARKMTKELENYRDNFRERRQCYACLTSFAGNAKFRHPLRLKNVVKRMSHSDFLTRSSDWKMNRLNERTCFSDFNIDFRSYIV